IRFELPEREHLLISGGILTVINDIAAQKVGNVLLEGKQTASYGYNKYNYTNGKPQIQMELTNGLCDAVFLSHSLEFIGDTGGKRTELLGDSIPPANPVFLCSYIIGCHTKAVLGLVIVENISIEKKVCGELNSPPAQRVYDIICTR